MIYGRPVAENNIKKDNFAHIPLNTLPEEDEHCSTSLYDVRISGDSGLGVVRFSHSDTEVTVGEHQARWREALTPYNSSSISIGNRLKECYSKHLTSRIMALTICYSLEFYDPYL